MRTIRGTRRWTAYATLLAWGVLGCKSGEGRVATSQPDNRDAALVDAQRSKEPSPGSAVNIVIDPRFDGASRRIVLTFCFEDDASYDPLIHRIRMARVDGKPGTIEIAAKGDSWLWKEWTVGTVPDGFRWVERTPTPPGVYEVYVDARVGDGVRRMSVANDGVRVLPWDQFDTGPPKHCPRVDRQTPNLIPRIGFQTIARLRMGAEGCPDAAAGPTPSKIVATIVPHPPTRDSRKIVVDVSYTNTGQSSERVEKRYVVDRSRPDNFWIYDRSSKRWLDYLGPHGRIRRPNFSDYVLLRPGEARVLKDVDLTSHFDFPADISGLLAKIMFQPSWEPVPRIESGCTPLAPAGAK
jgi:hypothetical protein